MCKPRSFEQAGVRKACVSKRAATHTVVGIWNVFGVDSSILPTSENDWVSWLARRSSAGHVCLLLSCSIFDDVVGMIAATRRGCLGHHGQMTQ